MADFNDIVSSYNNLEGKKEIEIRFALNKDQFYEKLNQFKDQHPNIGMVKELSFTAHKGQLRIEIYFGADGKKCAEHYTEKVQVKNVKTKDYKIAVARELPINKFALTDTEYIRFKNRQSFTVDKWRWDFTIIDELHKKDYANLKHSLSSFLSGNFITPYRKYEFEIEFLEPIIELKDITQHISDESNFAYLKKFFIPYIKNTKYRSDSLNTVKEITNNPKVFSSHTYFTEVFPQIDKYYITNKADGLRALIFIKDDTLHIFTDAFTKKISVSRIDGPFIFDAELIGDEIYVFDVLFYNDKPLFNEKFSLRWAYADEFKKTYKIPNLFFKNQILIQDPAKDIKALIADISKKEFKYENDGIIFTHQDSTYFDSKLKVYKWKPPAKNTIDFLLRKLPEEEYGKHPYDRKEGMDIYILFVYINSDQFKTLNLHQLPFYPKFFELKGSDYYPTHFCPSIAPQAYVFSTPSLSSDKEDGEESLDGKIFEMHYQNGWKIIKERTDRQIPNNFQIAEMSFMGYFNPFTEDKLYVPSGYFTSIKTDTYKAINKFNRYVSWRAFKFLDSSSLVFDLASGRGADMTLFSSYHVKNLVLVEKDTDAMEEAIARKYSLHDKRKYVYNFDPFHKMSIYAKILDIHELIVNPAENGLESLTHFGRAGAVVIDLAIHYIIRESANVEQFFNLVDNLLDYNGVFIFTCFNGEDILSLPQKWDITEDDTLKYSIHRVSDELNFKTKIKVWHAFSKSYYEEHICDIAKIIRIFKKHEYVVINSASYSSLFEGYEGPALNENDKKYASLYYYTILRKRRAPLVRGAKAGTRYGLKHKA